MNGIEGSSLTNGGKSSSEFDVISNPSSAATTPNGNHGNPGIATQISLTDMTLDDARQKLVEFAEENALLNKYMKENNEMMKRQYETLTEWKQKVQQANIANKEKFEQTKQLISKLREENSQSVDKILRLEKDIQEQYQDMEELRHENELLKGKNTDLVKELEEFKQKMSSIETMKQKAEEQGVEQNLDAVIIKLSLEKEEELQDMRDKLEKRDNEIKEMRSANENLIQDLEQLQKLKEQIQQDYQRTSRENKELSQKMETDLKLNSMSSVNWLLVKRQADASETMEIENMLETPGSMLTEGAVAATQPAPQKDVAALQQSTISDLMQRQDATKDQYEKQIQQLQTQVKLLNDKIQELIKTIQQSGHQIQELKVNHEQELALSNKRYEDKMAEYGKKVEEDNKRLEEERKKELKQQESTNENVESLRNQVMTLLKQVHDLTNKLEAANESIDRKTNRIKEFEEKYNKSLQELRELEEEKNQVIHTIQSRCNILQTNFTQEHNQHEIDKKDLTEMRKLYFKLVEEYREMLSTFECYRKSQESSSSEEVVTLKKDIDKLTCQIIVSEETLNLKDQNITQLKKDLDTLKKEYDEKVALYKTQAEVFKIDFEAERHAREKQAQEKNSILQEYSNLQIQNQQLLDEMELYSHRQLQEMRQRVTSQQNHNYSHLIAPRPEDTPPHGYNIPGGNAYDQQQRLLRPAEQLQRVEEHEFTCPKCGEKCPDIDTLQIHVEDCLDSN